MRTESVRRLATLAFAAAVAAGLAAAPIAAAQQAPAATGVISGDAHNEVKKPYENYAVWVVDLDRSDVVSKVTLNNKAEFFLSALAVPGNYLLQLVDTTKSEVVCTEGPFKLTPETADIRKTEIKCGHKVPVGFWLLTIAAAAGLAAALVGGSAVSGAQ
jgi:hypothetical protein